MAKKIDRIKLHYDQVVAETGGCFAQMTWSGEAKDTRLPEELGAEGTVLKSNGTSMEWGEAGGGGMDLLWETARVTNFSAQTLSFDVNLFDYTYIVIFYGRVVGAPFYINEKIILMYPHDPYNYDTELDRIRADLGHLVIYNGSTSNHNREITITKQNQIIFGAGRHEGSSTYDQNSYCIPVRIYGVK